MSLCDVHRCLSSTVCKQKETHHLKSSDILDGEIGHLHVSIIFHSNVYFRLTWPLILLEWKKNEFESVPVAHWENYLNYLILWIISPNISKWCSRFSSCASQRCLNSSTPGLYAEEEDYDLLRGKSQLKSEEEITILNPCTVFACCCVIHDNVERKRGNHSAGRDRGFHVLGFPYLVGLGHDGGKIDKDVKSYSQKICYFSTGIKKK